MPNARRAFTTLVGLHLRDLRGQFAALVIFSSALPLAFAAALHALPTVTIALVPPEATASARAAFIVAAALVAVLLGVAWVVLPQQLAQMRAARQFGFFAGFAVGRVTYLLALLTTYAIAALPGVVLVPAVTAYALKVPIGGNPVLFAVVPLSFAALATVGGLIGLLRLSSTATTALSSALYIGALGVLVVLALGATGTGHTLALLAPASLSTDQLTALLAHDGPSTVALDIAGLMAYTAGAGYGVYRLLPWRVGTTQPQMGG